MPSSTSPLHLNTPKAPSPFPLLALTHEACPLPISEQALRLCRAGARLLQVRLKDCDDTRFLREAREVSRICHDHGALCLLNDRVHLVHDAGADGVHLGAEDMAWPVARALLGPELLLGGTVNKEADANKALACACLDYVGVGPLRFTGTKKRLAPVLGMQGVTTLLRRLSPLPAWVIGAVTPADLPALHAAGAAGVAVCSALYENNTLEQNLQAFLQAWPSP